jgi:MoaA/NifB/PqqE/SkfB family radical SAM enzyme
VSTTAFNRPGGWDEPKIAQVALNHSDLCKLSRSIESLLTDHARECEQRFIRTTPTQLWDIYRYYKALLGQCDFPPVRCKAPWTSAVIEADGSVRPCPFHPPYGTVYDAPLNELVNLPSAVRFRRELRVTKNEICRSCVSATSKIAPEWIVDAAPLSYGAS